MSPRRLRWIFRLALYGTLAVIAAVVLASRPGGERLLVGETEQGEHVELRLEGDRAAGFGTFLLAACEYGGTRDVSWTPENGQPVAFDHDGDRFTVREEWETELQDGWREEGVATLEGRVEDGGDSASGEVIVRLRYFLRGRERGDCRADGLRWSARAG